MPKAQPPAAPPGPVSCLLPRGLCEVLNGLTINFHGLLCGERLLPVPGVPCLSPRVALWLRSRVQPQLWWPQNTGIILWHSHSCQHSGKWGSQQEQPAPGEAARHRSTTLAQGRGAEAVPSRKLSQLSRPPWHGAIPQECPRSLLQEPSPGASIAGKAQSGEAIWCEEKPFPAARAALLNVLQNVLMQLPFPGGI